MGIDGAALALVTVRLFTLLLTLLAVWLVGTCLQERGKKTWPSWSWDSLRGWDQYLKVSMPSMAMVCASWWIFEAVILIAGQGDNAAVQLPVMGILFSLHSLVFMLNAGFSAAASTRVSNLLGEGCGHKAQGSMMLCILLSSCIDLVCCFGLMVWSTQVADVFSSDLSVVASTVKALPWMVLSLLLDGCNEVLGGVLVGSGRQTLGFLTKLLCYWLVGLPLACLWGSQRGAAGMWQALFTVTVMQTILLGSSVARFDWDAEARRAEVRVLEGVRSMPDLKAALNPEDSESC
jgi:MATE family multidrug resistance protein